MISRLRFDFRQQAWASKDPPLRSLTEPQTTAAYAYLFESVEARKQRLVESIDPGLYGSQWPNRASASPYIDAVPISRYATGAQRRGSGVGFCVRLRPPLAVSPILSSPKCRMPRRAPE